MADIKILNMAGEETGTLSLNDTVFGIKPNEAAMHMAVVNYLAVQRQGTQSALTRAEVSGGGIKPWRQKGTGRARQGSIRAPQWTHGGIVFAPKPRDYRFHMNRKVRQLAIKSALSQKVLDGKLIVLDAINMDEYKTKTVVAMLGALNVNGKAMVVSADVNKCFVKSAANIPGLHTAPVCSMNVYDVLNAETLVLTVDAVKKLEEVYA